MASRSSNVTTFDSSKFKVESLEACATLLGIELADSNSNRIYVKSTLASRVVDGLFALLPSTCSECTNNYFVDHEDEDEPFFKCFKCYQGSHNCEDMRAKHETLKSLDLPVGMIWLCHRCLGETNPIKPRKTRSRYNSSTNIDDTPKTKEDDESPTQVEDNKEKDDKNKGETKESKDKGKESTETPDPPQTPASDIKICEKYKTWNCPHGSSGKKEVGGKTCPHSHPPRCHKYTRYGTEKKGCKKGAKCKYFHPTLCKFSLKNRECFNTKCTYSHLAGTKRIREKEQDRSSSRKRDTSQKRDQSKTRSRNVSISEQPSRNRNIPSNQRNRSRNPSLSKRNTTDNTSLKNDSYPDHFLELKKMVETMNNQFLLEISSIKSTIYQRQMCSFNNIPCTQQADINHQTHNPLTRSTLRSGC